MFCRLTVFWLLISLTSSDTWGQTRAVDRGQTSTPTRFATYSVEWQKLPLGNAVERLRAVSSADVFVDRRVDPSVRIDLKVSDARLDSIVTQLAAASSLGSARIGSLYYLGPERSADRIASLAAQRRREINSLPTEAKATLFERRRIAWPHLTEPRDLLTRLLNDRGWKITHAERIPHDLWSAGALPSMALADQLTLLLAGFGLTYRMTPDGGALDIMPVDWETLAAARPTTTAPRRKNQEPVGGKQVYTLRVESQPVGKILEQLSHRLGWKISVDEDALRQSGRTLDASVSFAVENANEDALLEALLAPAGLQADRDGRNVRVQAR